MITLRDAAQQALNALKIAQDDCIHGEMAEASPIFQNAIHALEAALAEPQPDLQDLWREAQQPQWDAAHRQIDADVAAGVLAEMDEVERLQAERDALQAKNRTLRGLLKECRKVVKADTLLRKSPRHIDLCKRISKATGGGK